MTRPFKPFKLDGQFVDDSFALHTRVNSENFLDRSMRDKGYIRAFDIDPIWSTWYDNKKNEWFFSMILYGTYVGKRKSWQYEGITQGKLIPRNTRQIK